MRFALPTCLLLGLASCFSDGGGETGATTDASTDATTGAAATGSAGTTSGTTSGATTGEPTTTGTMPTTRPESTTADPTTGADTDDDDAPNCEDYCNVYMFNCGDLSEYNGPADCAQQCSQWPVGGEDDELGDSVACRQYHAGVAILDSQVHCPHAGPSGAGVCVDAGAPSCEKYCDVYFTSCADFPGYPDQAACVEQCTHWYPGAEGDTSGHSVGCRIYHGLAAADDPMTHCSHAGPDGGGVCVVSP